MSNLKKVLSVGLASTMVLGMMTTAGAANYDKFTDKNDIEHKDAVSMVSELGIIAGLTNGSYAPKQNIDRASFARLVCVALNGGKEPKLGNLKTTFKDTQGNWAEPYIAYCVQQGIISGKGDNTFAPSANVTGSEAAKMLLVALGYNCAYENIGGANWQTATDVLANQAGLYDDLQSMNTSEPLTRDNAAQMIYNALDATKVKYEMVTGVSTTGQITVTPQRVNLTKTVSGTTHDVTMLEDAFDAVKVEGIVVANEFADLSKGPSSSAMDEGKTSINITNTDEQSAFSGRKAIFSVSTGEEHLGRSVTLYVKDDSSNSSKATVLGNVILSEDNKVVTDASGDSIYTVADDNDLDLSYSSDKTQVAKNYGNVTDLAKSAADAKGTKGVEKVLIDNDDDGDVDYVLLNTFELGKVTKYSTKDDGSITISAGSTFKADKKKDVVGFDDVKKDDHVLVALIGGKLHVQKAETVTGNLTGYKTDSSLTVNGTKYDVSDVPFDTRNLEDASKYGTSSTLKKEATFYLDRNGRVVAVGDAETSAYAYALVWGVEKGSSIGDDKVKLTLEDGTTKTYVVDSDSKVYVKAGGVQLTDGNSVDDRNAQGAIVSYSVTSSGEVKMEYPTGNHTGASATFNKNKTAIAVDGKTVGYANSSTTFFYVSLKSGGSAIDKVSTYTGYTNAPKVTSTSSVSVAENKSGKTVAVAFTGTSVATNVDEHLFVYKVGSMNDDDTISADVYRNGKDEAETIKISKVSGGLSKLEDLYDYSDNLFTYNVDKDGNYELDTVARANYVAGTVTNDPKTTLVVDNGTEYKILSSTVVIDNVDDPSKPDAVLNGGVDEGDTVMAVVNSDDEALMIVITKNGVLYDVDSSDITDAFKADDTVTVSGNITGDVVVPVGKTLVLTGKTTFNNSLTVTKDSADKHGNLVLDATLELDVKNTVTSMNANGCIKAEEGALVKNETDSTIFTVLAGGVATSATKTWDGSAWN
ncbi:S-layer homology domain-containing protein [Pseudoflavonifractor sp. MSJ-37]|uniref:S-layer homology domain-containing protein n=1 Tax=Pseudoflavonifractor sp. MSJ-37 TaxID=2841531 RepID=UPI001C0FEBF1|nr:S-layer homology domain-containing protein [Pseudoflavonifractor sp. MSJ-37]MBU5436312.1 S-layer homology domain-containing protein [Pseudoflavonifractor sp. MSJ-37]